MFSGGFKTRQYILVGTCLLVIAIVLTSLISAAFLREREIDSWERQLSNLSLVLADQTSQSISSAEITMNSIIERINSMQIRNDAELYSKTHTKEFHSVLRDKISGLSQIDAASIVASNGDIINFTRSFPAPKINLSDRDYFQAQLKNPALGTFISIPVQNRANGKWLFYLSRRLNDTSGRFIGLVIAGISVGHITDFFERLGNNLGEGASITLYRKDFTILTRWPIQEELIGKVNLTGTSYQVIEEQKKTDAVIYYAGPRLSNSGLITARLGAVRALEKFPMIVNLTVTEDSFLSDWRQAVKTIAIVAMGSIIAIIMAAIFLLRISRLRENSNSLLRDLSNQVPGILFQLRQAPDGLISFPYVNSEFLETYGLSEAQLPINATEIFKYLHPDDTEKVLASIRESAHKLESWHEDYRLILPNKGVVWRHGDAQPQKLADGSILWHGYIADITDRKQNEQKLFIESEKNSALLRNASDGIHIIDSDGNIFVVSDSFCTMLGYQQNELIGMNVSMIDANFKPSVISKNINDLLNGQQRSQFETLHKCKDGSIINVEVSSYPLELNGRRVLFNSSRDITQRKQTENTLRESEARFRQMFELHSAIMLLVDPESGKIVDANSAAEHFYGYAPDNLRAMNIEDINMQTRAQIEYEMRQAYEQNRNYFIFEHRRMNGSTCTVEVHSSPVIVNGVRLLFSIIHDITDRKRAEENLRITAGVFSISQEAIVITDANNNIVEVNPAFTRITGYSRNEVIGKNPRLLSSGHQDKAFYTQMWEILKRDQAWRGEIWNRRKSGQIYPELLSISALCESSGKVIRYVAVFSDISHLKEHEAELISAAHFDALTGIPNRILLADRMKQAIAQTSRENNMMAVCYLDLDGFKPINDSLGHEAGDDVLIEVAKRIGNTIRGGDTNARLGGDEFVVLLLGLDRGEECVATLERMLAAIAAPITLKNKTVSVSASIGVSIYPIDDQDPDTLLRHADQAMYVAKQSGKNRFHIYDPALDRRARDQHEFLKSIRYALEQNQFELYYQPKVNLFTQKLAGVEALIRWRHPERGLLPPSEFLHFIENTDLDIEIGEWVTTTALAQMEQWRKDGLDIEVSINITGYHLESLHFVEKLKKILASFPDTPSGKLQIEVLETVALNDINVVREIIGSCRALGIAFALDDFGTGYSSLSYLSSLPVDVLKIDQSFVRDMLDDKGDMAIVQGIIALATAFERQTVAEGIETKAHYQALLNMGCELGQGYCIARPMPADKLANWSFTFNI